MYYRLTDRQPYRQRGARGFEISIKSPTLLCSSSVHRQDSNLLFPRLPKLTNPALQHSGDMLLSPSLGNKSANVTVACAFPASLENRIVRVLRYHRIVLSIYMQLDINTILYHSETMRLYYINFKTS